jgi:ferredoxin-NADP reductase
MSTTITYHPPQGPPVGVKLEPGETVLTGLLRHGIAVPNSCRAGACQTCLMQATDGAVPAAAQRGLKDAAKARGLFMACAAVPERDLAIRFVDDAVTRVRAIVRSVEHVGAAVARVRLATDGPFDYFPGQFANVVRPADGLIRSYSLASLNAADDATPGDAFLELHVRKVPGGQMSAWLHDDARPGDEVELRGPAGDCFYVPGRPEQPILLIGTGTGLAPLWAIARDALRRGHAGPVRLYHGAMNAGGLYYRDELMRLATARPAFAYVPCVRDGDGAPDGLRVGAIDSVVLTDLPKLAGWRVFLCGAPALVNALRKRVYLAGAKMTDIHADAFVTRSEPA